MTRAVVLGGGFMGEVHAAAIRRAGGVVAGAVGSNPARSAAIAEQLGAERAYPTLAEALSDNRIDVVHICTPNAAHLGAALDSFAAGKHVVCEKPLGVGGEQARLMAAAAASAGVIATVPFVYRFHSVVREARARIRSGEVGPLSVLQGSYQQDWLADPATGNWRVRAADGGPSRAFADIGSHLVDLLEFVTGDPIRRLNARTRIVHPTRGGVSGIDTEDAVVVLVELESGAIGTLTVSQLTHGRKNSLVLELAK